MVVFLALFVAGTKIIFRYDFVAPLNLCAYGHFITKKAPTWIFLMQTKRIVIENFSVCSLNTKSFYHGLKKVRISKNEQ